MCIVGPHASLSDDTMLGPLNFSSHSASPDLRPRSDGGSGCAAQRSSFCRGVNFFEVACAHDLGHRGHARERSLSLGRARARIGVKIKNLHYNQMTARHELLGQRSRRHKFPPPLRVPWFWTQAVGTNLDNLL
jgi:hypothetical protein